MLVRMGSLRASSRGTVGVTVVLDGVSRTRSLLARVPGRTARRHMLRTSEIIGAATSANMAIDRTILKTSMVMMDSVKAATCRHHWLK